MIEFAIDANCLMLNMHLQGKLAESEQMMQSH